MREHRAKEGGSYWLISHKIKGSLTREWLFVLEHHRWLAMDHKD
jgi:hypothetical protein